MRKKQEKAVTYSEKPAVGYVDLASRFTSLLSVFIASRAVGVGSQFLVAYWMAQRGNDYLEASNLMTKYVGFIDLSGAVSMYATSILQKTQKAVAQEEVAPKIMLASAWVALTFAIPSSLLVVLGTEKLLVAFGQPEEASRLTQEYVNGYVLPGGFILTWWSVICQQTAFVKGGCWGSLVPIVNAIRQVMYLVLSYGWLFGKLGMSEYGVKGVGMARTISTAFDVFVFLTLFAVKGLLPLRDVFKESFKWYVTTLKKSFATGSQTFIEQLAEAINTEMIGLKGGDGLAASEIYAQYWQLANVALITASQSASIVAGDYQDDIQNAIRVNNVALLITIPTFTILIAALVCHSAFTTDWMVQTFISAPDRPSSNETEDIHDLASHLLWFLISAVLLGASKGIATGTLRGLKKFNFPLLVSVLSTLLLGCNVSGILCFMSRLSVYGVYLGGTVAATCSAGATLFKTYRGLRLVSAEENIQSP